MPSAINRVASVQTSSRRPCDSFLLLVLFSLVLLVLFSLAIYIYILLCGSTYNCQALTARRGPRPPSLCSRQLDHFCYYRINKNMHPRFFSDQKKAVELPIESLSNESTLHRADQFGRTGCYRATTVVCLIAARLVQTSCATQAWPSRTNNFSSPRSQVRSIGGLIPELKSIVATFRNRS